MDLSSYNSKYTKAHLCVLLLLATSIFAASFFRIVPIEGAYILILCLCVYSVLSSYLNSNGIFPVLALLINSFCLMLIVIDPIELGLYGFDPFHTLREVNETLSGSSVLSVVSEYWDFPGLIIFSTSVVQLLNLPVEVTGKYIPLVNIITPVVVFLTVKSITNEKYAVLSGFGLVYFRLFFRFESKFVPESFALPLFFVTIYLLIRFVYSSRKEFAILYLIVATTTIITHNVTGAVLSFFILCMAVFLRGRVLSLIKPIFGEVNQDTDKSITNLTIFGMLLVISLVSIFFYWNSMYVELIILGLLEGASETAETPTQTNHFFDFLSIDFSGILSIFIVVVYSTLNLGVLLRRYQIKNWEIPIVIFNGVLIGAFGLSLVFGQPGINLHPVRLLIFCIPFVILVANRMVLRIESRDQRRDLIVVGLILLFATVQIFLVPSYILSSSPGDVRLAEDNLPVQSRSTSEWVDEHSDQRVVGYKVDLWRYYRHNYFVDRTTGIEYCSEPSILVNRPPTGDVGIMNRIYDDGHFSLRSCR